MTRTFLNLSLGNLVSSMNDVSDETEVSVTLKVVTGKKNLVLSFDEDAENAVSGGALASIKNLYN